MTKHIIDGPRKREESGRLERYTSIERKASGKPATQSEAVRREPRHRNPGEKLRRFAELDRRADA